jgi:hypothetical protein
MADITALINETAAHMGARPLGAEACDVNCAETDGHTLFYNSTFMSQIEAAGGEDGVRFVVAHEMGHQLGGMDNGGHGGEFMADEYATRCLVEMGADFESIRGVFGMLHGMNPHGSETHPAAGSRASRAQTIFESERRNGVGIQEEIVPEHKHVNRNIKDLTYD